MLEKAGRMAVRSGARLDSSGIVRSGAPGNPTISPLIAVCRGCYLVTKLGRSVVGLLKLALPWQR